MKRSSTRVRRTRRAAPLLAIGCLVVACTSKDSSPARDAAVREDATSTADGGHDATPLDAADAAFASDVVIGPPPSDADTHPNKCTGPSNCENGQICCSAIGGLVVDSMCAGGTTCPSGFLEVCGSHGGQACASGSCREYFCTVAAMHFMSTIYACSPPMMLSNETCTPVPDAGFFSPDAAHD